MSVTTRIVVFSFGVYRRCGPTTGTALLETVSHHFGHRAHSVCDMVSFVEQQSGRVQRGFQLRFRREARRGLENRLLFLQSSHYPPPSDEREFSLQPVVAGDPLGQRPVSEVRILSFSPTVSRSSSSSPPSCSFSSWTRSSSAVDVTGGSLSLLPS